MNTYDRFWIIGTINWGVIMIIPTEALERQHIRTMRRIWRVAQSIIDRGLSPLLAVWPSRGDALPHPGEIVYQAAAERPRGYSPLSPAGRVQRVWNLSNDMLRRLWPQIPPEQIREYAPWAVSYKEVRRLVADQDATSTELQAMVRQSIELERAARPRDEPEFRFVESTRQRGAFRLRYTPEAMAIFDPTGAPIPPPPRPLEVTSSTISRQLDWLELALEQTIRADTITPAVTAGEEQVEQLTHRTLQRVLGIDLAEDIPELQADRITWYQDHVDLIESGVRAANGDAPLRSQSLLARIGNQIRQAHEQGLRVEEIAGALKKIYAVSDSRAELIARDQILKANGRLNMTRQRSVGITEYIWVTSRDRRVREDHARLHNTRQSWANPPPVGGGRHAHPGGDFQCRCVAKPVAPAWLKEK